MEHFYFKKKQIIKKTLETFLNQRKRKKNELTNRLKVQKAVSLSISRSKRSSLKNKEKGHSVKTISKPNKQKKSKFTDRFKVGHS